MKYYYGIIYLKNGSACTSAPCESEEEVREVLAKATAREMLSHNPPIATSFITREVEDGTDVPTLMKIYGCPRSRDLLKDKKFMKGIIQ